MHAVNGGGRLNCCVQGQGHSEGSYFIYTFLYHWSLSNPNTCAAVLITNNQTKCKQKRVRQWLRVSLGTQEEVFCHAKWQTLFAWEVIMTLSWGLTCRVDHMPGVSAGELVTTKEFVPVELTIKAAQRLYVNAEWMFLPGFNIISEQ